MVMYCIVCIISPWAIFLTSALNKGVGLYTSIPYMYISVLYLYENFKLKRGGWAYNT